MDTTFVNRANTNREVFRRANAIKNPDQTDGKNIKTFQQYVETKQESLLKHTIRADDTDPLKQTTFEPNTVAPPIHAKRRVGRPRKQWVTETYKRIYINNGIGTLQSWNLDPWAAIRHTITPIRNRTI